MKLTEDRIIPVQTEDHPGPWVGKQRVYQLEEWKKKEWDWFMVEELVYDANGNRVPSSYFGMTSGLCGTRDFLGMGDDEPVLTIKNTNRFYRC